MTNNYSTRIKGSTFYNNQSQGGLTTMTKTKLTLCTLAALFAAGQAFAHTGVKDQATEGVASYNAFNIGHGCGGDAGTDAYPVIGQVALFPFGANAVWRDAAGNVIERGGNGNGTIEAATLGLSPAGYAGFGSPFVTTQEIVDDLGNVQAILYKNGALEPKLNALTPFKITAPKIVDNCTRLKVRVAVINYCDTGKNAANDVNGPYKAPKDAFGNKIPYTTTLDDGGVQKNVADSPFFTDIRAGNGDNNRADWWFYNPDGGSLLYNDADLMPSAGQWSAVLTVNNAAAQAGCAVVKDVFVEPNGAAFDTFLTERNVRPFSKGLSNF